MHPLLSQIRTVSHQARRLVVQEAFARWLSVVTLMVVMVALADYLFRFQEVPLRWLCLISVAGVAIWHWRRSVGPALADRWSDGQIAQVIEKGIPELRDHLSSAISFLRFPERDPRFGSAALRADVVRRTAATMAKRNLAALLDVRAARRAYCLLMAAAGFMGALTALDHDAALLALRRLGMPWSTESWPRQHHLAFTKQPTVLAQGQDFEVELVNERGRLPADVTMLYWFDGDSDGAARTHRMTFSGGKMTHQLPAVTRSFQYRAVGGDDQQMEWTRLRVVVPPRIVESRIVVRPPSYTGLPDEQFEQRIRAIAGSQVELRIRVDKSVDAAVLCFKSGALAEEFPARVEADGRVCNLSASTGDAWVLTSSGTYGWRFSDRDGTTVMIHDNTEVDVVPDLPPVVSIESPESDSAFTAKAVVPVELSVKDDLAIRRIEFRSGEMSQVLGEFATPATNDRDTKTSQQHSVRHSWDLAGIPDLQPGAIVPFELVAEDFRPQSSLPASGTIRILSEAEFQQRLDEGQASLLQRLNEALQLQRSLHSRTSSLVAQLKSTKQLTAEDAVAWPVLDPGQRRVTTLISGNDGANRRVQRLLTELSVNRWDAPQLVAHLTAMQRELNRVADQVLPPVQQHLSTADRLLRFEQLDIPSVTNAWSEAASGQIHVIAALEALVDQLGQWDRYRNLSQEVRQLLDEHATLLQETRELTTAGRDVSQLTPEERGNLERIAQRLRDVAAQIDRMQSRLDKIQQSMDELNPSAAQSLRDALKVLRQEPVSGGIREASRSVADNRLGAATRGLEETRSGLQKLLAALERQTQQNAKQLEQLILAALAGFAARQESLIAETTEWGKRNESASAMEAKSRELSQQQTNLAADVRDLAQRTPKDSSYSLALSLADRPMTLATDRLTKGQLDEETLKAEQEALYFLKDLLASLTNESPPPKPDSESNQQNSDANKEPKTPSPSLAELKLIRLIHLEILRRTGEIENLRSTAGKLTGEQERELNELADQQRRLAELLDQMEPPRPMPESSKNGTTEPPSSSWRVPAGKARVKVAVIAPRDEARVAYGVGSSMSAPSPRLDLASSFVTRSDDGHDMTAFVLANWMQRPSQPDPPKQPGSQLDRSLLDDLPPAPARKTGSPAGEDIGKPGRNSSPFAELGRQMRQIESLLQTRDTTAATQQLQRRVAVELTSLIDQLQQQQSSESSSSQRPDDQASNQQKPSSTSNAGNKPGSGSGGVGTDKEGISNWARGVWGVLPDRVRQQIQDLGDEQFLPEYEEIIRQYYDRLSERGREK